MVRLLLSGKEAMNELFACTIPGDPKGQGSLTLWRGDDGTERAKHPPATVLHRNNAIAVLSNEWGDRDPILGPVRVSCVFVFGRPKAHYRTGKHAGELKDWVPTWQTSYPDLDKAVRLVGDALVIAGVVKDDSQIARIDAEKMYGPKGATLVEVVEL